MSETLLFSRISKFFLDRDREDSEKALARRQTFSVTICLGADLAQSYTRQLAALTAVKIAKRCFPDAVRVQLDPVLRDTPLLLWPILRRGFARTIAALIGEAAISAPDPSSAPNAIVIGDAVEPKGALRVTFDGWVAQVGPCPTTPRLSEREFCSLAGILAAALAVSETFFAFAGIQIEARRRTFAVSLWRPDLDADHADALGEEVGALPGELGFLGLGHLGNAYLWCATTLPYERPSDTQFTLFDFDKIEPENHETCLLFENEKDRRYKTRAASAWLERRDFRTKLIERRFDETFRLQKDEPKIALCGFDDNEPRRALATAGFSAVVESGLGGRTDNFSTIGFHSLPNPRTPAELWPCLSKDEEAKLVGEQKRLAERNPAYANLADECGRYLLAGKAVAVPFVGSVAATFVLAEVLRRLHDGARFTDMRLRLTMLDKWDVLPSGFYTPEDTAPLPAKPARKL